MGFEQLNYGSIAIPYFVGAIVVVAFNYYFLMSNEIYKKFENTFLKADLPVGYRVTLLSVIALFILSLLVN